jgi:dTDP-4-amino-4,6-dideoxygalactose transaminase
MLLLMTSAPKSMPEPATRSLTTEVPFVDLSPSHGEELKRAILDDIADLIDSGAFINGPQVAAFEEAFARYCGSAYCVGVASGLDALRLVLLATGIEPGDEVIVPANTFIATLEAVTQAGGKPVVVDVGDSDYNMDVSAAESAMAPRTHSFLPVHLYGQMTDMQALEQLAARHHLRIIEDACQAHGALRDGHRAGTVGIAGAFSFYPSKNLGAMGDAGAIVTGDENLVSQARALREHGQQRKYKHDLQGYTARLDTLQAAVLLRKLTLLEGWTEQRRAAARFYTEALAGVGDLVLPPVPEGSEPVWHLYVIRTKDAPALAHFLHERGIATARHYPEPAHLSRAFSSLGKGPGSFPVAERLARECLSLPIFPGISPTQLEAVVDEITAYFRHSNSG